MNNQERLTLIKSLGIKLTEDIKNSSDVYTQPGSITYLLNGPQISKQSISIKYGKVGELIFINMIKSNDNIELLKCGCHIIDDGKKKDLDLLWADHNLKIIYYREAKGNIEMDTEKIPAMISKINNEIKGYVTNKYPEYSIDIGVLSWSVYSRSILKKGLSHIKKIEGKGIKVDHFSDFLNLVNIDWSEEDFYDYFRKLGVILDN